MSNHFTGLSLGPPLGDQRLDLCDLYVFPSPSDPARTVIILNANPNADALHPGAIYRVNIDNDGDYLTDLAFSYVYSVPVDGKQKVDVFLAKGEEARQPEAVGTQLVKGGDVSFGPDPNILRNGEFTFFAGLGATPSSSTSTGSRTSSTRAVPTTSPNRISGPSLLGRGWTQTPKRTSSRWSWKRPRPSSVADLSCTSGDVAVCIETATCSTSTGPDIPR